MREKSTAEVVDRGPTPRVALKAERMRANILAVAEEQFARGGYAATRMDDVATAMGMTGAALFYYFRDKGALYDAMMANAFGALATRLSEVLSAEASVAQRIERAVEAWIDTIIARPAIARLILRHIADSEQHPDRPMYPTSDAFLRLAFALFEQGKKSGELNPMHDHPYHAASAVIGSTIFYASALAPLVPTGDFDPLSPEQIAAHKRDAVRITRKYLGIGAKPRASTKKRATKKK
ncbi:MAG: TetR/AcrR family transcriptional regulator [Polyangiales bacterium]